MRRWRRIITGRNCRFVYRTHEAPDEEKIRTLATFINNFGYSIHVGANEDRPKEIQKLLAKVEGSPQEAMISRLALRSMKQAKYTPENSGHFGLAAAYYTHFTPRIRRYPDLQIHRIIKDNIRGRMQEEKIVHYDKILPGGDEARKRDGEARRRGRKRDGEAEKSRIYAAAFRRDFRGGLFSITKWGMYVELPNTVEGLVYVANMRDDHYEYDENRYELIGAHTNKVYKLGQRIWIQVTGADRLLRTIDFEIAEEGEEEDGKE